MHFLLVEPGALGCLTASIVSKGIDATEEKLTVLDHNTERAHYLSENGITYILGDQSEPFKISASSDPQQVEHVDVILSCVKSYDVAASLKFCGPLLTDKTLVVFLQNGISHLELPGNLKNIVAAYGTTTEGATLLSTGQVRHAGSGVTYLGFLKKVDDHFATLLQKTQNVFATGGLQAHLTDKVLARLWTKLFVNVGINALTAILGCKNGELLTLPEVGDRMEKAIIEAVQIAEAQEIPVIGDPYLTCQDVCRKTAENVSSMLQDVQHKQRTEINAINGAVVNLGKKLGIPTPENSLLCQQIKEIEAGFNTQ
jgi:2-dehydropantoate 2-reductase